MAVIKLSKGNVPSGQQLLALSKSLYPNYTVTPRMGGRFVSIAKSGVVGATVVPRAKDVVVRADFGSTGVRVVFMLLIFATVLIFGLIYFIAFFPKQAAFANEVAAKLQKEIESGGGGGA
ncbi:MAG: hypothetical protein U1F43_10535 [Myxococcota bacterium]